MIMNAPVGPPICTRLPPSAEIMKPAITAVIIPLFGDTPEAIPNAMASGNATIPTIMPEETSLKKSVLLYAFKVVKSLGTNIL